MLFACLIFRLLDPICKAPVDMLYRNQSHQSQNYDGYGLPLHPDDRTACGSLFAPVREPAGALGTEFARLALGKADSDDEDADSEAERQQAPNCVSATIRVATTVRRPGKRWIKHYYLLYK